MFVGKLVFAQLMDFLPMHTFRRCVARHPSNYPTKTFSHLDQFLCMAFAQLTFRESLRDIEVCLRAQESKPLHLHPYYEQSLRWESRHLPVASRQWTKIISLPLFPGMTAEECNYVVRVVKETCNKGS